MFARRTKQEKQSEFWVVASRLPVATPSRFYELVERTLQEMEFPARVWELCRSAYAAEAKGGRPGIDPVVYLKMLMIGFFEDLPSERAIASRCADSLSVRGFLGYDLCEATKGSFQSERDPATARTGNLPVHLRADPGSVAWPRLTQRAPSGDRQQRPGSQRQPAQSLPSQHRRELLAICAPPGGGSRARSAGPRRPAPL